jgi:exodeoxyribonuclease VII large subunit
MRDVYSVTVVNRYIKQLIEGEGTLSHIYVRGEVSNCKYHTSGHIYFTLKDGGSAIACVMFSGQRIKGLKFRMTEGMQVVVFGSVSVYERDGRYQLYAAQILQEGVGYLYEKYEQLKGQLEAEGLFDAKYKKKLPAFPSKVGIVTASTGAAIQDILNISGRRNPYVQLVLYPAKVQGQGAAKTIVEGVRALDKYGVDVMIVGRGGGSIEDLWAFNEECVARAVFECQTPVISAVGHESDWTIVDYVSDLRAPTPSAAAELAVPDVITLMSRISEDYARMNRAMHGRIEQSKLQVQRLEKNLKLLSPGQILLQKKQYLSHLEEQLHTMIQHRIQISRHRLEICSSRLEGVSPIGKLSGGYAFVSNETGQPITDISKLVVGDILNITMRDGIIDAAVTAFEKKNQEKCREECKNGKDKES